jgi:hypothetical protein
MVAVDFDHELQLRAVEIGDERADWFLAAKFVAPKCSGSKTTPDQSFGTRWKPAHLTRERSQAFGTMGHL